MSKAKPRPPPEDKQRYLEEAQEFAASLVKELNDTDGKRPENPMTIFIQILTHFTTLYNQVMYHIVEKVPYFVYKFLLG